MKGDLNAELLRRAGLVTSPAPPLSAVPRAQVHRLLVPLGSSTNFLALDVAETSAAEKIS